MVVVVVGKGGLGTYRNLAMCYNLIGAREMRSGSFPRLLLWWFVAGPATLYVRSLSVGCGRKILVKNEEVGGRKPLITGAGLQGV